jgi:hypothetical protein
VGVLKDRPNYFLPYVIFGCLQLVQTFIGFANNFDSTSPLKKLARNPFGIALEILMIIVPIYFVICVYSYYVDVKKRQKEAVETAQLEMKA